MSYEMTRAEIASTNQYMRSVYPHAQILRNSSRRYNCHSFAWYSTSASNSIWLNDPGDNAFWEDGSYSPIRDSNVPLGARITYYADDHSAIAVGDGTFVSKWGQGPVMWHWPEYCPYESYYLIYFVRN
jgi:hypothetical protein